MKVFVTGASGWIGSAVVPELIGAGHQVTGLARSAESAAKLTAAGAETVSGTLDDFDVLRDAAAASDGVVHLAFKHDVAFSGDFPAAVDADRRAVEALCGALEGSDRPFVLASGLLGLTPGRVTTEQDDGSLGLAASGRADTAHRVRELASTGVRTSVLRLPPTVHGDGDNGFMAMVVATARAKGVSGYVGDGSQRWPAAHRSDAARLFRLALESAPAGSVLHAAADEGVPLRDVAEAIGDRLGLPVASIPAEQAGEHFGWLGALLSADSPASAALTRDLLDWNPTGPGLLEDLAKGHYFA